MPSSPHARRRLLPLVLLAFLGPARAATLDQEHDAPSDGFVGALLPSAPSALEVEPRVPSFDRIRSLLEVGDTAGARFAAERYVASAAPGRPRDAALVAIGMLHAEAGRHNLACEALAQVRAGEGPLASLATHAEAEQEAARGQHARAIARCAEYRARWPDGAQAADCLRIVALAAAELDRVEDARAAAAEYDAAHPLGKISEQVSLAIATRLAHTEPDLAIPWLVDLAVHHGAALTGRVAEEELARLRSAGHASAVLPTDAASQMARARSLREAGRRDAAWGAFLALSSSADPAVQEFVSEETERFAWHTQRWDALVAYWRGQPPDAESDYRTYKVLIRAGKFEEAATFGAAHLETGRGHWRRAEDEIARTWMLAGRYTQARALFDVAAERGGTSGRRAARSAAFAAFMAGERDDALARFDAIVAAEDSAEARYWRARTLDALGQPELAAADRAWLTAHEPWGWYATLLGTAPDGAPVRAGRWAGPASPVQIAQISSLPGPSPGSALPAPVRAGRSDASASFTRWSPGVRGALADTRPEAPSIAATTLGPPASYRASPLFDPVVARAALTAFAETHGQKWPDLRAVSDLASVGLYDLSGPLMNRWVETWRLQVRKRDRAAKRLVDTPPEVWRILFLAARDHHDAARATWGWWNEQTDPALITEAYRLAYPLAHDRYVWEHAPDRDLDPWLVLGLMRQESTYDANARSRVGARGAMQIMPRTGHLLADLAHDTSFDAGDLEDPTVAVGYGMRYLSLLMERFGGVFPLAVASYNAGPVNVSNWMSGTGAAMPIDEWVEHIPYRETRDYVKRVTENYAAYVSLYAPSGARVAVPPVPNGDRRDVVDF